MIRRRKKPGCGRQPGVTDKTRRTVINSTTKELQIKIKPMMTSKLKVIAEREGIDPIALVLLQVARLINEKGGI